MKVAIYPGSFDPITNGHLSIVKKAIEIFDKVIILVAVNKSKSNRFSVEERIEMIENTLQDEGIGNVEVDAFDGLTAVYSKSAFVSYLIRGIRNESDFEYEMNLYKANKYIDENLETIFFIADKKYDFLSSSAVMELYSNDVDVSDLVPSAVIRKLSNK